MRTSLRRLLASLALLLAAGALWAEPVRIGVLAFRSKPQTLAQWKPLETVLERQMPERDFEIEALDYAELNLAVASRRLDFVLTNPGHYVLLAQRSGLSAPLATLVNAEHGRPMYAYGGTILTLASSDIRTLADLRGRRVATATHEALAGYQMQAYELAIQGIPAPAGELLVETGMPHDRVVEAVLGGRADAGFVRSSVIEQMAREGKLDLARVRVLNWQDLPGLPWAVSTRLYPEWPFAALPHIDEHLARNVTAALFLLDHEAVMTRAMGIHGFTVPSDYAPVVELLRELRLPPFDVAPRFTLGDVWERYRGQALAGLLLVALVVLLSVRLMVSNRRLSVERKRAEEQAGQLAEAEELWRFALEGAGDGVWDWDVKSGKTKFSRRWKEMIGYREDEFEDSFEAWAAHLHPEDKPRVLSAVQDYFDGKTPEYVVEFRLRCKDGSWKWILGRGMVASRDADGKPLRMIGTHADIDARKQAEMALAQSNAELEQFAYSVSHDMRQPLRMVSGHLQLLEKGLGDALDADQRETLHFALDGAKRMDSMIVSLLEYSRVGRKTEAKAWQPSRAALDEALGFLEPLIRDAAAEVSIAGEWPQVYASRDELARLFQNLIGNGIKFCEAGKPPRVEIESAVDGGTWRVTVRDHGIGIDPQQIDRLFQFFSRLQSRARYDGTGMGLALCRRIVEHHGGRISAESEGEGQGSVFVFELPLGMENAAPPGSGA
ncbi:MAG TPA: PhnD/SsuA/transferrin family substrate-binding protein [Gallionella sp.]|nr:PhnD/SsuA/transferrin family substrate-binding protein [Gallionella sp.]